MRTNGDERDEPGARNPARLPPHQITNLGSERATHYIVELLGPSAVETAQPPTHNGRIHVEPQ